MVSGKPHEPGCAPCCAWVKAWAALPLPDGIMCVAGCRVPDPARLAPLVPRPPTSPTPPPASAWSLWAWRTRRTTAATGASCSTPRRVGRLGAGSYLGGILAVTGCCSIGLLGSCGVAAVRFAVPPGGGPGKGMSWQWQPRRRWPSTSRAPACVPDANVRCCSAPGPLMHSVVHVVHHVQAWGSTSRVPSCSRRRCTRRRATGGSSWTSCRRRASTRVSRWTPACRCEREGGRGRGSAVEGPRSWSLRKGGTGMWGMMGSGSHRHQAGHRTARQRRTGG